MFCRTKADRVAAGTGGKTRSLFRVRKSVPAKREEAGVTAAVGWLVGEIPTAVQANTGTEAALNDGMHFEQGAKKLPETRKDR